LRVARFAMRMLRTLATRTINTVGLWHESLFATVSLYMPVIRTPDGIAPPSIASP
jgi:hypothetical protein